MYIFIIETLHIISDFANDKGWSPKVNRNHFCSFKRERFYVYMDIIFFDVYHSYVFINNLDFMQCQEQIKNV